MSPTKNLQDYIENNLNSDEILTINQEAQTEVKSLKMKTIKEYILENYEPETIKNIIDHGCVSGSATDLIYYHETVKFHDEYETEIWGFLWQDSQDQGITICELIASLTGQKDVGSIDQFKNLLTWYAVERQCFIINHEEELA